MSSVCTMEPDVPVIESKYVPAEKLAPLMVRVAVAGNELTVAGTMLQLPAPNVVGHASVTVPVKPSCDVMEMAPVVPELPALTSGKAAGSVMMKSEFAVTTSVNEVVSAEEAPLVEA